MLLFGLFPTYALSPVGKFSKLLAQQNIIPYRTISSRSIKPELNNLFIGQLNVSVHIFFYYNMK